MHQHVLGRVSQIAKAKAGKAAKPKAKSKPKATKPKTTKPKKSTGLDTKTKGIVKVAIEPSPKIKAELSANPWLAKDFQSTHTSVDQMLTTEVVIAALEKVSQSLLDRSAPRKTIAGWDESREFERGALFKRLKTICTQDNLSFRDTLSKGLKEEVLDDALSAIDESILNYEARLAAVSKDPEPQT